MVVAVQVVTMVVLMAGVMAVMVVAVMVVTMVVLMDGVMAVAVMVVTMVVLMDGVMAVMVVAVMVVMAGVLGEPRSLGHNLATYSLGWQCTLQCLPNLRNLRAGLVVVLAVVLVMVRKHRDTTSTGDDSSTIKGHCHGVKPQIMARPRTCCTRL